MKRIDDRLIAAQPVEGRARRLECGVEEVAARDPESAARARPSSAPDPERIKPSISWL